MFRCSKYPSHWECSFEYPEHTSTVLCLGQDFWGTPVSLYLNFRGTFTNSGGHTKSFKFLPVKLNSYPEISVHFSFKFELDVNSFGSRRGIDDSEVVFAIALVLNSPANLLFLYWNSFFWPSAMKFKFSAIVFLYWTGWEINIQCDIYQ